MKEEKLTLIYHSFWEWEVKDYLLSVDGIKEVNITLENKKDIIDIVYDGKKTNYKLVLKEIELFAGKSSSHYLCSFNKHMENTKTHIYKNANICCEYCFEDMIMELFKCENVNSFESTYFEVEQKCKDIIITYTDDLDEIINIIENP